jgi:hypothetical protein
MLELVGETCGWDIMYDPRYSTNWYEMIIKSSDDVGVEEG